MLHQYDSRCFNSEPKLLKIWLTDKNGSKNGSKDEKQVFKPNINTNTNLKIISNNRNQNSNGNKN